MDFFKLEKLKIHAYKNSKRAGSPVGTFEAMFNPESFDQSYEIEWGLKQGLNSSGKAVNYSRSLPAELSLDLILDGTGVNNMGRSR